MRWVVSVGLAVLFSLPSASCPGEEEEAPLFQKEPIFATNEKHNHASCIIETAENHFLAVWYSGTGERSADDVLIEGAWRVPDREKWGPRFLVADTQGYPDCNPALFQGANGKIWVFWPTILDHRWESALLKYQAVGPVDALRPISWTESGVIHITPDPKKFETAMAASLKTLTPEERAGHQKEVAEYEAHSKDLLYQRLGWMPRVHAIALPGGHEQKHPSRWILPLYSDTFSASIMAFSDDQGKTWKTGEPMIGFGNIQPSLIRKNDGTLVAYMRDNGPHHRIRLSTSSDDGETWSPVVDTDFPNPGAGIEAIRLASGNLALIYNDTEQGRHSLAVSLSDDEGATWKWTRHLERMEPGQGSFHYPSMIQGQGNRREIHTTYTYKLKDEGSTIVHARFNEAWIRQGDDAQ
jgi:predicted neuraminidase